MSSSLWNRVGGVVGRSRVGRDRRCHCVYLRVGGMMGRAFRVWWGEISWYIEVGRAIVPEVE